jgi:glycosyltransferase involved in cell wall biosynthesis
LKRSIGVAVPCHNEAKYLDRVLGSLVASLADFEHRIILIADRCTDDSAVRASRYCEVIQKERSRWRNTIAENRNLAFQEMIEMDYLSVVDADMVVPPNFYTRAVQELERDGRVRSVSSPLYTEPSSSYNKVYHGYELAMERLRLTRKNRKHGHRLYNGHWIRDIMDKRGTVFADVLAEDSELDKTMGGPVKVMRDVLVWHIKETSLGKSMRNQIRQGRAARQLGSSGASVAKEIFRLRPLVLTSYLVPWSAPT